MISIDFVYAPSKDKNENWSMEAPLGPLAVISSLPQDLRKNVRFLDSTILTTTEIKQSLIQRKADVVAFSCTTFNYEKSLDLADIAKKNGSTTVFGGIHITYRWTQILAKMLAGKRPINFLIPNFGEPTFYPLIRSILGEIPITDVPGIMYINNGKSIIQNPKKVSRREDPLQEPLDFSLIDFPSYHKKYVGIGNLKNVSAPSSTYTERGCAYSGAVKCTFCSIEEINQKRSARLVSADVKTLVETYHADHIRINDGDFTASLSHMKNMAVAIKTAVSDFENPPSFYCFTRADELNIERIEILKSFNVCSVFIGYESGSKEMLKAMHKNTTPEQNLQATILLKDYNIDVACAGLVLGGVGENQKTLDETLNFVQELSLVKNTVSLVATPLIPLPGAPDFNNLIKTIKIHNPSRGIELENEDIFDLRELIELWNRHFCSTSLSNVIQVSKQIEEIFPIGIRFLKM